MATVLGTAALELTVIATVLLTITGCGEGDQPLAWAGTIDTIGGVPVVRNPAEPIHPFGAARLERVWIQGGPPGAEPWQEPKVLAASGGDVFVLDGPARRVYRLDGETGEQVVAFGRQGEGPNELNRPLDIAPAGSGDVIILDRGQLKRFDAGGTERSAQRIQAIGFGLAALDPGRHMMTGFGTGARLNVVEGDSLRGVEIPAPRADVAAELGNCERLEAVAGHLAALSCVVPYYRLIDPDGELLREVLIDRRPTVRPDAELDSLLTELRAAMAGMPSEQVDAMVRDQREGLRFHRPFTSLRHDTVRGWLSLLEEENDPDRALPTLHLFDLEGRYTAAARDSTFWWDYAFLDGDIVALVRDRDTGLVGAARYRLVLEQ